MYDASGTRFHLLKLRLSAAPFHKQACFNSTKDGVIAVLIGIVTGTEDPVLHVPPHRQAVGVPIDSLKGAFREELALR